MVCFFLSFVVEQNKNRLSKEFGALINSITTSLLDMIEVSGFFAVLAAVAKV
jgi:hypothetical protein